MINWDVIQICNYIYSKNNDISPLALQKYLWYVNWEYYFKYKNFIFNIAYFEAWRYGALIPWLWKLYNTKIQDEKIIKFNNIELQKEYKICVDKVIKLFKNVPYAYLTIMNQKELEKLYINEKYFNNPKSIQMLDVDIQLVKKHLKGDK